MSAFASPWSSMKASAAAIEAGVERIEHRPAHRDAIVAFEHGRGVGEHDGDGVAAREAALRQRRGERLRAGVKLAVVATERPMHDRRAGPGRPRRRARAKRAASAAGNWRGCDRDRDRRATGTSGSSGSDRRHHTVRSGLGEGISDVTSERRSSGSRRKSRSSPRRPLRRQRAAGSPASRRRRSAAREGRRPNRPRS